ncbi:MAG: hypothetical protein ABR985_20410, partial [Methanotrichaceae archaeon]
MATITATELTIEHYRRPEVKEIITKFALPQDDGTWRALNCDFRRWYAYNNNDARLLNAKEDYEHLTDRFRVLYQTLNVFDHRLWMVSRPKEEITSENPLGTPADTLAYTLGVDIDKGRDCTLEDPEIKAAVEDAAKFLVDCLKAHGIHQSVWVLFSGGGIYVEVHHEIVKPKAKEGRAEFFEFVTDRYNRFIGHISEEFFKAHPEHIGKVKYDALNNAKRIFKSILSIHKSKPYAVTPLNRDDIKIDFERARIPLKDDMIPEARLWYSSYDPLEREPLFKLLDEFAPIQEDQKRQKQRFEEIWRSEEKVNAEHFPPCIKYMVESEHSGEGKNRISAILSTYLYEMGWDEDEAFKLVKKVADRNGVSEFEHIFDSFYGHLSCPSCATVQTDAVGFPHMGLKGLGVCRPDKSCGKWPGDYGTKTDPTVIDAIKVLASVCDGAHTKDRQGFSSWDLRKKGDLINKAVSKGYLSQIEESKLYKLCYKYRKQLDKLGVPFADIEPIHRKKQKTEDVDVGESACLTRDDVIDVYEVGDNVKERFSPTKTVEAILTKLPVVMGEDGLLYYCHEGIWAPNALPVLSQALQDLAGDLYTDVHGLKELKQRLEHKLEFQRVKMDGNPYLLGVQNGVLDLRTEEFRDYEPDDYISMRIPVKYDPNARCPVFLRFLESITNVVIDRLTLIDWIAIHAINKAFPFLLFLLGLGRNGKRVYEYVLESFYGGPLRFSHMDLGDTSKSNFAASALMGKVGRIVAEAGDDKPGKKVICTGFLKKCTGDDIIESDRKNTTHVQFSPTFKTTIDCNDMPLITDMSVGWAERFVKISLLFTFVTDP